MCLGRSASGGQSIVTSGTSNTDRSPDWQVTLDLNRRTVCCIEAVQSRAREIDQSLMIYYGEFSMREGLSRTSLHACVYLDDSKNFIGFICESQC